MKFDDYEQLPTTSVSTNMMAGAIAGVLEHLIMYPLDSVKTRMQSLSPKTSGYNITSTFRIMIKKEGLFRPIRGVTAVVAGAGPAHAFYFATYEFSKEVLTKVTTHSQINYITSAVAATLIHDGISNPTDVIKQRLQMYNSPFKSVIHCMRTIYKTEGLKAFYRSYSTQLMMNLPYQAIHFSTYEFFQNKLNCDRRYNPMVHVVAGAAAGAAASAFTTPLDVVKTLLNTQETGFTRGMPEAARKIYKMAGPLGFFKGLRARVLYAMPATAICWSTYEFFKYVLCGLSPEEYKSSISGKSSLQPKDTAGTQLGAEKILYVLPNTNVNAAAEAVSVPAIGSNSIQTTRDSTPAASPIKSVCELSTPSYNTINLNTMHTDVQGSSYERQTYTSHQ